MLVRNVELVDLDNALAEVNEVFNGNIRYKQIERLSGSRGGGHTYRLTLTVKDSGAEGGRRSASGRRIAAACWHAHGVYLDNLPEQAKITISAGPDRIRIKPGDKWVDWGGGDQMKVAASTGTFYMGSAPWASELCLCSEQELKFPLPPVLLDSDYGDPMIIVDNWDEMNRLERIINAMSSDGMGDDREVEWHDPHSTSDNNVLTFSPGQIELGFSDEYDCCHECGAYAVRTTHDSYQWQLSGYRFEDGELVCKGCLTYRGLALEVLNESVNHNKLLNLDIVDPEDHGWVILCDPDNVYEYSNPDGQLEFENGWHKGQSDDPQQQLELLNSAGIDCLFSGWVSQFYVKWVVWVKSADADKALLIIKGEYTGLDYDPGTEMGKALRGEPSDHYTVTSRQVSREEFIEGIKS